MSRSDSQLRLRSNFPPDSAGTEFTFKKKSPFKSYGCDTDVYPSNKYEEDTECKCEQDVSWIYAGGYYNNWYQHACTATVETAPVLKTIANVVPYFPDVAKETGTQITDVLSPSTYCSYSPSYAATLAGMDTKLSLVLRYPDCAKPSTPTRADLEFKLDPFDVSDKVQNAAVQLMKYVIANFQ